MNDRFYDVTPDTDPNSDCPQEIASGLEVKAPDTRRNATDLNSLSVKETAHFLAEKGFAVFPVHGILNGQCECGPNCKAPGKRPHVASWQELATRDSRTIERWWTQWPNANIGIPTGEINGIFVVDVDSRKDGHKSLAVLEAKFGRLNTSYEVLTGSGGGSRHLVFAWPTEEIVKNSADRIAPGIDVRGAGGYVVGPNSQHLSGARYRFANHCTEDLTPVEAPKWLLDSCREQKPDRKAKPILDQAIASTQSEDQKPLFEAVARGCAWVAEQVENASALDEPNWYAMASIVGNCANGRELFHRLSAQDPRYDQSETDQKLDHALSAAGPRRCDSIVEQFGSAACKNCPFRDQIGSPINLGHTRPVHAALMRRYAYELETQRYVDLEHNRFIRFSVFNDKHRHDLWDQRDAPHTVLMKSKLTKKCDKADYLAGTPDRFVNVDGLNIINLWQPSDLVSERGDCSILIEHLEYLFPDAVEREHVSNYLAHMVQRPAEKIRHGLLVIGEQGTGKSFLGKLMKEILGHTNVGIFQSDDVLSEWTAPLGNLQLLAIEELMAFGRMEVYNRLKTWITEDTVTANEKYVPKYQVRTPKGILALSNHDVPISLGSGDRRWFVSRSEVKPKSPEYYERLFQEGLSQAAAFLYWLGQRNLSGFSSSARPPMTASKEAILERSKPVLLQELEALMHYGSPPFHKDLFTLEDARRAMVDVTKAKVPSQSEMARLLKMAGAVNLRQIRDKDNQRRLRLWAWRHIERWYDAERREILDYLSIPETLVITL